MARNPYSVTASGEVSICASSNHDACPTGHPLLQRKLISRFADWGVKRMLVAVVVPVSWCQLPSVFGVFVNAPGWLSSVAPPVQSAFGQKAAQKLSRVMLPASAAGARY